VWEVPPYEAKQIGDIVVISSSPKKFRGYVSVRTNVSQLDAVVPVDVDVSGGSPCNSRFHALGDGLYFGPTDSVDFGAVCVKTQSVIEVPLMLATRHCKAIIRHATADTKVMSLLRPAHLRSLSMAVLADRK
jgi:hypothetical protein